MNDEKINLSTLIKSDGKFIFYRFLAYKQLYFLWKRNCGNH